METEEFLSQLPDVTSWEELLANVTHRPDWEFSVQNHIDYYECLISIDLLVEDTYHPGKMIRVNHRYPVPPFREIGQKGALEYLRKIRHSVEIHESDEWFRFRGEMIYDPHAKERR